MLLQSATITGSFASIDPKFHAMPAFIGSPVLLQTSAAYQGNLTIDTTKLANGYHKLFIRNDVTVAPFSLPNSAFPPSSPFPGGTNSGILVVAFQVQN